MFSPETCAKLQFYVYALIDSRDNQPFYVGYGKGDAVFAHAIGDLEYEVPEDKIGLIKEIISEKQHVKHVILRHGLTFKQAQDIVSTLTDFCRVFAGNSLEAIAPGYSASEFGAMKTDQLDQKYGADLLAELGKDCVVLTISDKYDPSQNKRALYEAARGPWAITKNRQAAARYALADYRGFVVGVFKINEWEREVVDGASRPSDRFFFDGEPAPKSVLKRYQHKRLPRRGASQNPVRFHSVLSARLTSHRPCEPLYDIL